jgi:hypothetical protein
MYRRLILYVSADVKVVTSTAKLLAAANISINDK